MHNGIDLDLSNIAETFKKKSKNYPYHKNQTIESHIPIHKADHDKKKRLAKCN